MIFCSVRWCSKGQWPRIAGWMFQVGHQEGIPWAGEAAQEHGVWQGCVLSSSGVFRAQADKAMTILSCLVLVPHRAGAWTTRPPETRSDQRSCGFALLRSCPKVLHCLYRIYGASSGLKEAQGLTCSLGWNVQYKSEISSWKQHSS